jgi:hypothetical protein
MCKTFETSLSTFVFTLTCAVLSIKIYNSKEMFFAAALMFTVSLMQLIDAGIWWSIHNKNKVLNDYLSRYAIPIVLSCELLVSYFGVNHFFGWRSRHFEYTLAAFVTFILTYWPYRCYYVNTLSHTDGYLHWCKIQIHPIFRILFILFLLAPVLVGIPSNSTIKYILALPTIATFLINYSNDTFGARWCWSSNIVSLLILAYSVYMKV